MGAIQAQDFLLLAPEILLAAAGLVLLLVGSIGRGTGNRESATLALVALVLCAGWVVVIQRSVVPAGRFLLGGSFVLDEFAFFWKILVLLATVLTVLLSVRFVEEAGCRPGEYYALLLLATTGMLFMASAFSLLAIWISLELMALASYVLAGYFKRERRSIEAALKYFVLGALSSGILLYGISLLYGATGTIQLTALATALPQAVARGDLLVPLGWILLAVGLFFKVAAAPFHVWTPDVYVGAPTPVTAYLATASKAASFAILLRIFFQALPGVRVDWQLLMALVAAVSMIWGNLAALTQDNVKRMLAYSSIGHAGYVLVGVVAVNEVGAWAVAFYLLAYSFVTAGAFGTVVLLERREYAGETCADYAGLYRRSPFLAAMMLVFMLALTGIPPTGGFVGKFYLFAAAVEAGWTWLAVLGVLMSALSLYYYFRIVVFMYQHDETSTTPVPLRAPTVVGTIAACAAVTLLLGLVPGPFIEWARASGLLLP
jgi:NADH-quinone oxidoreductase subunit N